MPTITLNKTVFEQLVGKRLPLDQLKDRISMLGTDLEKIEGNEIHVEVFPNRPDMLSEQGFARAFSSFIGAKKGLCQYSIKPSGCQVIVDPSVTMRPFTACAIVKNITFTDERIQEVMQIQEKLATTHGRNRKKSAYGIYPLDAIHFPISYIAKDPRTVMFQPLGFQRKIPANQVEELHPAGQKFKQVTQGWTKYPFFIDAKNNILCMLPYTNSESMGKVTIETRNIFIECTGTDLKNVLIALNIFAAMFADMGGDVLSVEIAYPDRKIVTPDLVPGKMPLDIAYANRLLGLQLGEQEAVKLLERMGYGYDKGNALIPAYRADILHQVDLVEDIAIAYGYENFVPDIPNVATIGEEDPFAKFCRKVREILVGLGFLEVKNYHLLTKDDLTNKMLQTTAEPLPIKNAVGEHNHLRHSLLSSLMKSLHDNQRYEYPQRLFEIGRVFFVDPATETGVGERDKLGICLAHETADFTEILQIAQAVLQALGIKSTTQEIEHPSCIPGRAAQLSAGNGSLGIVGEIHPQVITNWRLLVPVVAAEIDLEKIFQLVLSRSISNGG